MAVAVILAVVVGWLLWRRWADGVWPWQKRR